MGRRRQRGPGKPKKNPPAKRQNESTHTESGRAPKAPKFSTPQPPADKGTEDVGASSIQTSAVMSISSHCSLTKYGKIIYAENMEARIAAEARGVTRKNVPWDTFCSIYLWSVKEADVQRELDIDSVQKIGKGDWEEGQFWARLCNTLHNKVCCPGRAS